MSKITSEASYVQFRIFAKSVILLLWNWKRLLLNLCKVSNFAIWNPENRFCRSIVFVVKKQKLSLKSGTVQIYFHIVNCNIIRLLSKWLETKPIFGTFTNRSCWTLKINRSAYHIARRLIIADQSLKEVPKLFQCHIKVSFKLYLSVRISLSTIR